MRYYPGLRVGMGYLEMNIERMSPMSDGRNSSEPFPAPTFAIGDVVRLKSGGVPMTVICRRSEHVVDCVWQDHAGTPHGYAYPVKVLVNATATDAVTGEEVPVESVFNPPEDWRGRRGL